MTGWVIWLAVFYGLGMVITAIIAGISFSFEKEYGDEDARRAALWLIGAPIWPLLVIRALLVLITQAKAALTEKEKS